MCLNVNVLLESGYNHHSYNNVFSDIVYILANQIFVMKDIRGITGSAGSQSSGAQGDITLVLPIALALSIFLALSKGMRIPRTYWS